MKIQASDDSIYSSIEKFNSASTELKNKIHLLLTPKYQLRINKSETDALQLAINAMSDSKFDDKIVTRVNKTGLHIQGACSFKNEMLRRNEAARSGFFSPAYYLNEKTAAYAFADVLGAPHPKLTGRARTFDEIDFKPPFVLKLNNAAGGVGVYTALAADHVTHMQDGRVMESFDELRTHAIALVARREKRGRHESFWLTEELITESGGRGILAHDFKVYCAYGVPLLGVEMWRLPSKVYRFYTPRGEPIELDHVVPSLVESVEQSEVINENTRGHFHAASEISAQIPDSFIRVDFLITKDGRYLGEFTPKPGIFSDFNVKWDTFLGASILDAEKRLIENLLSGLKFSKFNRFMNQKQPTPVLS